MRDIAKADRAAFSAPDGVDIANHIIGESGLRIGFERRRGPRRRAQPQRALRAVRAARPSTTAGTAWTSCRRSRPTCRSRSRRPSSRRNTSPDISFDRSINPYRGCEHGCVYCFARPTHAYMGMSPGLDFEIQAVRQAERRRASGTRVVEARLPGEVDRHRHQHRSLPADREGLAHHARDPRGAGGGQPSGRHRHEVGAGPARHRHPVAHGGQGAGQGRAVGDHSRPDAGAGDGAARGDPDEAAGGGQGPQRGRHADHGDDRADHSRPYRFGDRAAAGGGADRRRAGGRLRPPAPAAGSLAAVQGLAAAPLPEPLPACPVAAALDARRQGLRRRMGQADARHRALCLPDPPPLRNGGTPARPEREAARSCAATCSPRRAAPASSSPCSEGRRDTPSARDPRPAGRRGTTGRM